MRNQIEIQQRFLKENGQMRLGHLASDLARAADLLGMNVGEGTVRGVMEEAKFFSEWAGRGPDVPLEIQMFLAEIQSLLALKEQEWSSRGRDSAWRKELAGRLHGWSDELLKKAGFLNSDE